jgi:hypothetical protein
MKTTTHTIKIMTLVLALGVSCKKKSSTTTPATPATPAPTTNGSMTAKLNNSSWTSTKNTAQLAIDKDNNMSGLIINGETANDYFVFGVDIAGVSENLQAGPHDVGGTQDDIVFVYTQKTQGGGTLTQHICDEGQMLITQVDYTNKKFSGTFSFKLHKIGSSNAADSLVITNGVFTNISYIVTH